MIVTGYPQFNTQNDDGFGDGIPPIHEWQLVQSTCNDGFLGLDDADIDPEVRNVLIRLRHIFQRARRISLSTTTIHDLACFVIHRLLRQDSNTRISSLSPTTECFRCGIMIYMFYIQGTTYFSHAVVLDKLVHQFIEQLGRLDSMPRSHDSFYIWCLTVGMVASSGTDHYGWFVERLRVLVSGMGLVHWDEALLCLESVLWLKTPQSESNLRSHWDGFLLDTQKSGLMLPTTSDGSTTVSF